MSLYDVSSTRWRGRAPRARPAPRYRNSPRRRCVDSSRARGRPVSALESRGTEVASAPTGPCSRSAPGSPWEHSGGIPADRTGGPSLRSVPSAPSGDHSSMLSRPALSFSPSCLGLCFLRVFSLIPPQKRLLSSVKGCVVPIAIASAEFF